MSVFSLVVTTDDNAVQVANLLSPTVSVNAGDVWAINREWSGYFAGVSDGAKNTSTVYSDTLVVATATMTSTGSATAAETFILANVTFTARASGATGNEFNVSGTVATQAANIAAAINASTDLAGIVTATSALGVVTITSVIPGFIGNSIQFSESLTNVTITQFTGGSEAHRSTVSSNK